MTNEHTPGPWSYYTEPQPNGCPIVGARGLMVAMLAHSVTEEPQRDEALANARLIAAAPELLAALVAMEELVVGSGLNGASQQVAKARAAIAKAEGR